MPAHPPESTATILLRHGLITASFCCLIAAGLALSTGRAWDLQLVYSLAIGMTSWLVIDLGRIALHKGPTEQWPTGAPAVLLVLAGIATGFLVGSTLGDLYCGCSTWQSPPGSPNRLTSSVIITVAASVAVSYFFHTRGQHKTQQAQIALAERDAAQARLKLLQTQLEPHMLFNTLANLRVLIGTDAEQATRMLDHLIAYLRATLVASRATVHPMSQEFERLHDYLELMAVRMGLRLRYDLDLPAELANWPVPTLLLQPLVENSIRHGLEPQVGGGSITVRVRAVDQGVQLEVVDTGAGWPEHSDHPQAENQGTGFGLAQVRERLATAYGPSASLQIGSAPGRGTRCCIVLPPPTA